MSQQFLSHYGILGMKWGVRRYQNEDGSLTPAGKKRISKEYKNESVKFLTNYARGTTDRYVNAFNKTAEALNNGLIEKYNEQSRKKYGENYGRNPKYEAGYEALHEKLMEEYSVKEVVAALNSDPHLKKAQELVKKYDMTKWDNLAKDNEEKIAEVRAMADKYTKPTKKAEKPLSEKTLREIESSKKYLEKRPDLMVVYDKKYGVISYASKDKANRKLDIDYSDSSRYAIYE